MTNRIRPLRPRYLLTLLLPLAVSQACGKGPCEDTDSCGHFTPNSGCGWRLEDGTVAWSVQELDDLGGVWSESDGWTMSDGSHPEFLCGVPLPDGGIAAAGTGGMQGNGGNSQNGGNGSGGDAGDGAGGQNGGGNGGQNGNGGSGGVINVPDGGFPACGANPVAGCQATEGIFVDASAPDGGDGTLESPLNSINDAFALAVADSVSDIFVCAGNYDENVIITDNEAGIDLHGGFACGVFVYDGGLPVVSPAAGGYALRIDALQSAILIEDMAFTAVDADDPGESSIAAFVSESIDVTLQRCAFAAGTGFNGADGVREDFVEGDEVGVNWPDLTLDDQHAGSNGEGGATAGPFMCPAGDSSFGGKGGDTLPEAGTNGGPAGRGGDGGDVGSCFGGGTGEDGSPGADGMDGAGAPDRGTLSAGGFTPGAGEDGEAGQVGGGGGGGAGASNGGGGSGGGGGCGGNFGPGGMGGGASVALLAFNSTISLEASSLVADDAGDGGFGREGQAGQEGGSFAVGNPNGCSGGLGASGGTGGGGGGGAGGLSVGILWSGTAPGVDDTTTDAIVVGEAGVAGMGGGAGNHGVDGIAQALIEL